MEEQQQQQQQATDDVVVTSNGQTMTATVNTPPLPIIGEDPKKEEPATTETPQEEPKGDDVQGNIQNAKDTEKVIIDELESKGIDFNKLSTEYETNGELSKESLEQLEKAGYPKQMVDAYIRGLEATAQQFFNTVINMAGGQEQYNEIVGYLQGQPKATIDAFNSLIEQGNLGQIQLAIQGIQSQIRSSYGTNNSTLMGGQNGVSTQPLGYSNTDEMVKDMNDPRYQVDPAFTAQVYKKIENAQFYK